MSILPLLLHHPLQYQRPTRLLNQHFGLVVTPEDLLSPPSRDLSLLTRCPAGYIRPWSTAASATDFGSIVHFDKDKFLANLDVQQFAPEEITVKITGEHELTVEGKHEEKADDHGLVSRQFVRRYVLTDEYDIHKTESRLSSDGVLTLTAPKIEQKDVEHKHVPITHTGQPAKSVQSKEQPKN